MFKRAFPFEIKELSQSGEIIGLAAAFGNVDAGGDRIAPGAFAKSLAKHAAAGTRPAMLLHHDMAKPIGTWISLSETSEGLIAKGRLTLDVRDGAEAYALARDGALSGLSIGYVTEAELNSREARELLQVQLLEVSLVSIPMNERARISSVKAIAGARDIEDLFRESGLSGRMAKRAAGAAWRAINQNDDAAEEKAAQILKRSIERLSVKG